MDFDPNDPRPGRFHEEHYNPFKKSSPGMLSAAMLLAVLSVFFFWMIYLAIPLGAIAIILAFISRGGAEKISRRARNIIITAAVGMTISAGVTGYAFYTVFTNPEMHARFNQVLEYYTRLYAPDTEGLFAETEADSEAVSEMESDVESEAAYDTASEGDTETSFDPDESGSDQFNRQTLPWETTYPGASTYQKGDFV